MGFISAPGVYIAGYEHEYDSSKNIESLLRIHVVNSTHNFYGIG